MSVREAARRRKPSGPQEHQANVTKMMKNQQGGAVRNRSTRPANERRSPFCRGDKIIISEHDSRRGISFRGCFRYSQLTITRRGPLCDTCRKMAVEAA